MIRLAQFWDADGERRIAVSSEGEALRLVDGFSRVYDLAQAAIQSQRSLETIAREQMSDRMESWDAVIAEKRLFPPLDHADPARCLVSLTGLTHVGSAMSRDQMHAAAKAEATTDTARMFQLGLIGGKPPLGEIGAQPEWAYKGDGRCVIPPEQPIIQPDFADDGGEEAEIAGLYLIGEDGTPYRVGFAIGNEFADHILEKKNYLYLAHSKVRPCSFGPELLVGELPDAISGTVRIVRNGETAWSSPFETGEAHMCHSIANLEHHHFKYEQFRRPGDIHIHYFGANGVSFGAGFCTQDGDIFEVSVPLFGRPLRNPLTIAPGPPRLISVRGL